MDTNDRRLIDDLAQEISTAQPVTKDPEAAQVIEARIGSQPDAVYLLTQAVLLQQDALRQAQAQIDQLQAQLAQQRQQQSRGGGLFSGLFGGGQGGFGQAPYGQPQYAPPSYAQRGSSSFLAQAASNAVGIAGGLFLFEGISDLFGGNGFAGGQDQAFEQGYDQGFDSGFDQGQGDQGQADAGQSGFDQSDFDQAGWDNGGDFDGGGDWGV